MPCQRTRPRERSVKKTKRKLAGWDDEYLKKVLKASIPANHRLGPLYDSDRALRSAGRAKEVKSRAGTRRKLNPKRIRSFVNEVFGANMRAMGVLPLGSAVVGVIHAAVLAIHAIGQAYAQSAGITSKSGAKQVDRLLSNQALSHEAVLKTWANFVVGGRPEMLFAMDWMEFNNGNHSTLAVYVASTHGPPTPLAWRTYRKSELKGNQKRWESEMVERIHERLDPKKG